MESTISMRKSLHMESLGFAVSTSSQAPRGIAPTTLLAQVKNTIPFLFDSALELQFHSRQRYLWVLKSPRENYSHESYFELCLSAHHATVASFVPTDVDNAIRFKLWSPALPPETLTQMADLIIESHKWDWSPVSARFATSPESGDRLSGHDGEWFSTAVAAYAALRKKSPDDSTEIARLVFAEIEREAKIFEDARRARRGIEALKATTLIAHNLGDLNRVIEMWNLPGSDPFREEIERLVKLPSLLIACDLNRDLMAIENHRHFTLRIPRALRRSPDFLLPVGPFFDEWGMKIARHPGLAPEEIGEIALALIDGWERLQKGVPGKGPVGYSRALAGILEGFSGGASELSKYLPARAERVLRSGLLRSQCAVPQKRFEENWNTHPLCIKTS